MMLRTRKIGLLVACLIVTAVIFSIRRSFGSDQQAQEQKNLSLPLSKILNNDLFARRLESVNNPHLTETGKYMAGTLGIQDNAPTVTSEQAYILRAALWDSPQIDVCWENPEDRFASQMKMVQQAVADTWSAASKLRFGGWKTCPAVSPADAQLIRIVVQDQDPNNGPRTLGLGRQLAGVRDGMLLNFTFLHWSPACQTMLDYCIKGIAVHEFGHAIGFAHEQNRPDSPGECMKLAQGSNGDVLLTPYDPNSVMNYCNRRYNNDGNLSALDTQAVRLMYGA